MLERFIHILRVLFAPRPVRRPAKHEGFTYPLSVFQYKSRVAILCKREVRNKQSLFLLGSKDGLSFVPSRRKPRIILPNGREENLDFCSRFSVIEDSDGYVMTYVRSQGEQNGLVTATSFNLLLWKVQGITPHITTRGSMVPHHVHGGQRLLFYGGTTVKAAISKSLRTWYPMEKAVIEPRESHFDKYPISIVGLTKLDQGVFVVYDSSYPVKSGIHLQLGAALISEDDPQHVTWRSDIPLWEQVIESQRAQPVGAVVSDETILAYWSVAGKGLLTVATSNPFHVVGDLIEERVRLEKHEANPLMSPRPEVHWEAEGVFNPATIQLDGKVHFIYRAVGRDGSSQFGYASSKDGLTIDEREDMPAYWARMPFEGVNNAPIGFSEAHPSGGGWGGCEDPKIVQIGDTIYLTYVAMPGHWPTHTAISSISVDDFINKRWYKWSIPAMMSPPEVDSKSACLLSEKVDGKYVIFHRSWPDIVVDYVSDLDFYSDKRWINPLPAISDWRFANGKVVIQHGTWPDLLYEETEHTDDYMVQHSDRWKELTGKTKRIRVRHNHWDSHKISLAATPIKTEHGWLAVYGGVDKRDKSRYKIGAMLLDLKQPEKVLHRTNSPILIPEQWYEHDWKPNIVYPSGNLVIDGTLYIYYGGGDKHICVATAPLDQFLSDLMNEKEPKVGVEKVKAARQ